MLHRIAHILAGVVACGVIVSTSWAQSPDVKSLAPTKSERSDKGDVPKGLRPPAGMCRVWIDNVPAGRQPAPTDCASAIRNRPPNGRVIFSEEPGRAPAPKPASKDEPRRDPPKQKKPPESS